MWGRYSAARVGNGWNFVGCNGVVNDESGHGTHTAGTALGLASGVAKCATLHPAGGAGWGGGGGGR